LATDIIVVPLSTRLLAAPTHVLLRRGEGGLDAPSVAKCEQVTTLRTERLLSSPLGGALSKDRMIEVEKALLRAIEIPVSL
jgi:mRNA interferase MazF